MKLILACIMFFMSLGIVAQNTIEKNLNSFHELKVYDLINVTLIKSDSTKAIISGDNMNEVSVEVDEGILRIKMDLDEKFDGNKTNVLLYYKEITIIDVNEGAFVGSEDTFAQTGMELRAQEGGFIKIKLDLAELELKAVTGGEIEAFGKATKQNISLNTGGIYKGQNLKTETTVVAIRAGGTANVNASDLVDAKVRAGGDIFIYGNPKEVNQSKALGGQIKRMD